MGPPRRSRRSCCACSPAGGGSRTAARRCCSNVSARRRRGGSGPSSGSRAPSALFRSWPSPKPRRRASRGLGLCGDTLRSPEARALLAKARAVAAGGEPRLFRSEASPLSPAGALGLEDVRDVADASRRLRELAESSRGPAVWIAVAPEDWDPLSRRAFESAVLSLSDRVELVRIPGALALPASPADWRRALWVPCGTIAASVRFYERFAELAPPRDAEGAVDVARRILSHGEWARFAADPTGDAPWPEALAPPNPAPAPQERGVRPRSRIPARASSGCSAPGRRGPRSSSARSWIDAFPGRAREAWFPLAARLVARSGGVTAPWLEALEAEREAAGGRTADARSRLERLLRSSEPAPAERRLFASAAGRAVRDPGLRFRGGTPRGGVAAGASRCARARDRPRFEALRGRCGARRTLRSRGCFPRGGRRRRARARPRGAGVDGPRAGASRGTGRPCRRGGGRVRNRPCARVWGAAMTPRGAVPGAGGAPALGPPRVRPRDPEVPGGAGRGARRRRGERRALARPLGRALSLGRRRGQRSVSDGVPRRRGGGGTGGARSPRARKPRRASDQPLRLGRGVRRDRGARGAGAGRPRRPPACSSSCITAAASRCGAAFWRPPRRTMRRRASSRRSSQTGSRSASSGWRRATAASTRRRGGRTGGLREGGGGPAGSVRAGRPGARAPRGALLARSRRAARRRGRRAWRRASRTTRTAPPKRSCAGAFALGESALPEPLRSRAERVLRAMGGEALAEHAFPSGVLAVAA